MKKVIFVLSFVFSMLFASTTFAATENSYVCEKSQVVSTEMSPSFEANQTAAKKGGGVVIITDDTVVIITEDVIVIIFR